MLGFGESKHTPKRQQVKKAGAGGSIQRGVGSLSIRRDHRRLLDIVEIIVGKLGPPMPGLLAECTRSDLASTDFFLSAELNEMNWVSKTLNIQTDI